MVGAVLLGMPDLLAAPPTQGTTASTPGTTPRLGIDPASLAADLASLGTESTGLPDDPEPLVDDQPPPDHIIEETAPEPPETIDVLDIRPEDGVLASGSDLAPPVVPDSGRLDLVTPARPGKKPKKPIRRGQKYPSLEPVLLMGGADDIQDQVQKEVEKAETIAGALRIEEHAVQRRAFFRRWTLETATGKRIPLRSTMTLMAELKKDGILDQPVNVTGRWFPSPSDERLRFFEVERIEPLREPGEIASGTVASGTIASGTIASGTTPGPALGPDDPLLATASGTVATETVVGGPVPANAEEQAFETTPEASGTTAPSSGDTAGSSDESSADDSAGLANGSVPALSASPAGTSGAAHHGPASISHPAPPAAPPPATGPASTPPPAPASPLSASGPAPAPTVKGSQETPPAQAIPGSGTGSPR